MSQPLKKRSRTPNSKRRIGVSAREIDAKQGVIWPVKASITGDAKTYIIPREYFGQVLGLPNFISFVQDVTGTESDVKARFWQLQLDEALECEPLQDDEEVDVMVFTPEKLVDRYFVNIGGYIPCK